MIEHEVQTDAAFATYTADEDVYEEKEEIEIIPEFEEEVEKILEDIPPFTGTP